MHILAQHLPQGVVEHMGESVVGQDALALLLVPVAAHCVPYPEGAISLPHMQHIPSRYLQPHTGGPSQSQACV